MITTDRLAELVEEAKRPYTDQITLHLEWYEVEEHAYKPPLHLYRFRNELGMLFGVTETDGDDPAQAVWPDPIGSEKGTKWANFDSLVAAKHFCELLLREATLPLHAGEIERLSAENARLREENNKMLESLRRHLRTHLMATKYTQDGYEYASAKAEGEANQIIADFERHQALVADATAALQETPRD